MSQAFVQLIFSKTAFKSSVISNKSYLIDRRFSHLIYFEDIKTPTDGKFINKVTFTT